MFFWEGKANYTLFTITVYSYNDRIYKDFDVWYYPLFYFTVNYLQEF